MILKSALIDWGFEEPIYRILLEVSVDLEAFLISYNYREN